MIFNEEEMVMLMIMAYGGMTPRGIQAILPIGVNNALKWKNRIGMDKFANKIEEKFKSKKFWWGNEEFDELIMSIAVHDVQVAFKEGDNYLQSFFQSNFGYAILEFKGIGIYEARVSKNREEWYKELIDFTKEFINKNVNSDKKTSSDSSDMRMYIRKPVNKKKVKFELILGRDGNKVLYKKMQNKFFTGRKLIDEREIDLNNISQFLQEEIILEGEK